MRARPNFLVWPGRLFVEYMRKLKSISAETFQNKPGCVLWKLIIAAFTVGWLCFFSNGAAAMDKSSFEIDVQTLYMNYNEAPGASLNGQPFYSQESGVLNGLRLSYLRQNPDADRDFRINAFITTGNTNYNGTYQTGVPTTGVSGNWIFALEALTMYDYIKFIETQLYCGLGYRRWYRNVCSVSGGDGINETYSWLYVPVGLRHNHEFSTNLNCEIDLSARLMLAGDVNATNISINGQTYGVDMKFANKYGVGLRVPFQYKLNREFSLVVTPWADYSEIGSSNWYTIPGTNYQIMEPSSQTWQYGTDIGVRYTF